MIQFHQLSVGGYDSNFSYVLHSGNGDTAVVDPCGNASILIQCLKTLPEIRNPVILLTHSHPDHVDALPEIRTLLNAPVLSAENLSDSAVLPFGTETIRCMAVPGHSADSYCYYLPESGLLITGDTLFIGYIGFGRPHALFDSLKKIALLPDETKVLPGHDYGSVPVDTLGSQKKNNPFFITDSYERFREQLRKLT